jgi:hypothetical protein
MATGEPTQSSVAVKMATFLDIAPCSVVQTGQRFKNTNSIDHEAELMALRISEMSLNLYQTVRRNSPEGSHLQVFNRRVVSNNQYSYNCINLTSVSNSSRTQFLQTWHKDDMSYGSSNRTNTQGRLLAGGGGGGREGHHDLML